MKLAELQQLLSKAGQYAADAEVKFKAVEGEVETVVKSVEIALGVDGDPASSTVTVSHGEPAPAPEPEPATAPDTEPAADPTPAS